MGILGLIIIGGFVLLIINVCLIARRVKPPLDSSKYEMRGLLIMRKR